MPSVEILVAEPHGEFQLELYSNSFAVKVTRPPLSDRKPSLWQQKFSAIGGALVHLGETRFKAKQDGWFFAYDLLDAEDFKNFTFKRECFFSVATILLALINWSAANTIYFTTDYQFGPKPRTYKRVLSLGEFLTRHSTKGLRFNSCWKIVEPQMRGCRMP